MRKDKMYKTNYELISLITGETFPIYSNRGYYMVMISKREFIQLEKMLRYDFTIREV